MSIMKSGPVTQQDIADKLKISRITVSKALRNHPDISAEMKERVRQAVEEMGYSPNLIAKQLSLKKSFTIGIVLPDLENSFFAYLVDSIIDVATEHDYQIIITVSRENEEIERQNILKLLSMRVDGMLVCISQSSKSTDIYHYAKKVGIPLVFFDRVIKGIGTSYATFDDKEGTRDAINSIARYGYKKIAHFAGYSNISIGKERSESFKSALEENGLLLKKEWLIEGGFEIEDGYSAFEKLISYGPLPEIIVAVNDRVALGAYKAIFEAGLNIPEDIGIIGYGFIETARHFNPSLAVINQDPRVMGRVVAQMLIEEIQENPIQKPSEILINVDFQWNNSVFKRKT